MARALDSRGEKRAKRHTREHTSRGEGVFSSRSRRSLGEALWHSRTTSRSVWGRVVPDIPAFCRELVAALAEG
jgi:hypothetical protein